MTDKLRLPPKAWKSAPYEQLTGVGSRINVPKKPKRTMARVDPMLKAVLKGLYLGNAPWPLFLWGPVRKGKTCAILAMIDAIACGVIYKREEVFARELNAAMAGELTHCDISDTKKTEQQFWKEWTGQKLAVMDELGVRNDVSEPRKAAIGLAVDKRIERPTIYISNHPIDGLGRRYGSRIIERLREGTVFHLEKKYER